MKFIKFKTLQRQKSQSKYNNQYDLLDEMAIKWARKAEYYKSKKYRDLATLQCTEYLIKRALALLIKFLNL